VRNKFGLVVLGVTLVSVSGCSSVPDAVNPISWYRDATGLSKNDDLGKGQNEQNLAEGSNEPYPNLGNVPSAPDNQLSGVDRDKLVKSLVADRNNAQYSADNLRAGDVAGTVPPPAPPAPKSDTTSSATLSSAPASPPPEAAAPPPPPVPPAPEVSSNAAPPSSPPPATPPAPTPSPAATASAVPPPAAAPAPSSPNKATATNTQQKKPPARGSEAPPAESSLQSPSIPNLPQGETPTPAPPPPARAPSPVANDAPPPSTRAPALRAPGGTSTQQATAPGNTPATTAAHRPGVSYRVADVSFAPGSAYLSGALRGTIAEIVKIHNTEGGTIRVVGFGESTGKDAAVAGLTLALDRAQAVAVALTDAGVEAKYIAVEAAPVAAKGGTDAPRAEVYIEQ
jgi:outer membrane protein OmpA-like peptidoglycan-associated protein